MTLLAYTWPTFTGDTVAVLTLAKPGASRLFTTPHHDNHAKIRSARAPTLPGGAPCPFSLRPRCFLQGLAQAELVVDGSVLAHAGERRQARRRRLRRLPVLAHAGERPTGHTIAPPDRSMSA